MIRNTYYLLNKAENRVLSTSPPQAKTNLAPLILPKRENISISFQSRTMERTGFFPLWIFSDLSYRLTLYVLADWNERAITIVGLIMTHDFSSVFSKTFFFLTNSPFILWKEWNVYWYAYPQQSLAGWLSSKLPTVSTNAQVMRSSLWEKNEIWNVIRTKNLDGQGALKWWISRACLPFNLT